MSKVSLVSIVVTYNGSHRIKSCMDSLLSSDLPTKIIVVDNNSTDSTKNIIRRKYPQIHLIENQENMGFGKANNIGFKMALNLKADYIFLLNQDAKVETDTLQKLVETHLLNQEYGILSPIHLTGSGNALDGFFTQYLTSTQSIEGIQFVNDKILDRSIKDIYSMHFINAAAWLISKKCVEDVGGFNPIFTHYAEDNNYVDRLKFHGHKIGLVPKATIYHDRGNRLTDATSSQIEYYKRSLLLSALNPNEPLQVRKVKRLLWIKFWQSFIELDMKNTRFNLKIFKEFSSKVKMIESYYEKSKSRGPIFLDDRSSNN